MVDDIAGLHAVIQAGGSGERLRAAAEAVPKPLIHVGGIAMIERLLNQIVAAGLRRITVVVNGRDQSIETHVRRLAAGLPADIELDFFVETRKLGNAGALGRIDTCGRPALLCFADLVTNLDFGALWDVHVRRGVDATLTSHYEFHRLSLGELVVEGDRVCDYREKPEKRFLICSGIGVFSAPTLRVARDLPAPFGLSDLVCAVLHAGYRVTHWLHESSWIDVNTPELLARARAGAELDARGAAVADANQARGAR